jgi:hypothetical protein
MYTILALIALPMVVLAGPKTPTSSQQTLFGCTITTFAATYYNKAGENLIGDNRGYSMENFQACIEKCLMTAGCVAINFVDGNCQPFKSGITDAAKQAKDFIGVTVSSHATINCPEPKASGPVGCGKQAAAYQPTVGRATVRIIGGNEAKPHSWPWQVYLMAQSEEQDGSYGACGASLIRVKADKEESDILVTAGHCVTYGNITVKPIVHTAARVSGIAGEHDLDHFDAGQQTRVASAVVTHPKYVQPHNDIAIVKLATPIKFTDTIRPICLPAQGEALPVGKRCAVSGWGRTSSKGGETARTLKQLAVNVWSAADCKRNSVAGWGSTYIESEMVCAGSMKGDEGVCQGDSGGMLACESTPGTWTLHGIASFVNGLGCVNPGFPAMFVRASMYVDFINEQVKKLSTV